MIDVEVEDEAWTQALPEAAALAVVAAQAAVRAALAPSTRNLDSPPPLGEGDREAVEGAQQIVILLTDDACVQDLNARFRGKDAATNVLSFPAPENFEGHLGDVALAFGVCAREAAAQGKTVAQHLQHLVTHGVLHLFGYDHIGDDEAEEMEGLERVVLAGLGVPDPYRAGERDHD